jgi:hypothetical protein
MSEVPLYMQMHMHGAGACKQGAGTLLQFQRRRPIRRLHVVIHYILRALIMINRFLGPLGPLCFNFAHHSPTTHPSVERTAKKAFLLSDRVSLSSAEARVEEIKGWFCWGA